MLRVDAMRARHALLAILLGLSTLGASGCSSEPVDSEDEEGSEDELRGFTPSGPGEVSGSQFVEAGPVAFQRGRPGLVRYVVIHDIEGSARSAVNTFRRAGGEASAHYVISATGEVIQMVKERDIANHAFHSVLNAYAIGIEHEGFSTKPYAPAVYDASARAVAEIVKRYRIPIDREHIVGHHQVPKTDEQATPCPIDAKTCGGKSGHIDPGPAWDWAGYMQKVTQAARALGYDSSQAITDAQYKLQWVAPMESMGLSTASGARPRLVGGFWGTQCLTTDLTKQVSFRTILNAVPEPARAESRYVQPRSTECGALRNGAYPIVLHGYKAEEVQGLCLKRGNTVYRVDSMLGACASAKPECLHASCKDPGPDCVSMAAYPIAADAVATQCPGAR